MYGLEVLLAKEGESEGVYFDFPTTRKEIWEVMSKNGIEKNKWHLAGVKTGSNPFGEAVLASRSLDELNYLGYMMDQLTDEEYGGFFLLCNAGFSEGNSLSHYINVAANVKNSFEIPEITNAYELGVFLVEEYFTRHDCNTPAVWAGIDDDEIEEVGLNYIEEHGGKFYNGSFLGKSAEWTKVYSGNICDIPDELLVETLRI